jgi:GntR family transcriptional regulator
MRQRIDEGEWPDGHRLPSLDELAAQFGVARVTARQAVTELERDGLIWRAQGKGTFVTEGPAQRQRLNLRLDWCQLVQMIEGTEMRLLHQQAVERPPRLNADDGIPAGNYWLMRRVHSKDGAPYAVIDIYLDRVLFDSARERFEQEMVLAVLDDLPGVNIAAARQRLTLGTAGLDNAGYLEIPVDAPVARVRRLVHDRDGRLIYVGDVVYRGDFVRLDIDLVVPDNCGEPRGKPGGESKPESGS